MKFYVINDQFNMSYDSDMNFERPFVVILHEPDLSQWLKHELDQLTLPGKKPQFHVIRTET